ncbi:MAG TPA: maleylpyruvate isomerase family mycothiol-dependent enzyme [Jatrophihabitantaceae bacterium]|nr:maleylpyruvate isomerase family mycothiol-dependent enzyme [Jatrophihabitantaceae bacterium]
MPILDEIARERAVLADLLDTLTAEQLAGPSLCGAWTIHQVAGHLLMPLVTSPVQVGLAGIRARGNFDRANDLLTRAFAERPIGEISAGLRTEARNRFHPPIFGLEAPMAELVLHGEDIRRPLGLPVAFPPAAVRATLEHLAGPRARIGFVPRGRLRGLRLEADDVDWSHGAGELVRGPGVSLAYAMSGRSAGLADLHGPGVAVLASR